MSPDSRLTAYSAVSTALALLSDRALQQALDAAAPIGSGIGGKSVLLEVAGTQVFVKRVPLTDLERRPEHIRSTANLFELPDAVMAVSTALLPQQAQAATEAPNIAAVAVKALASAQHEGREYPVTGPEAL